MKNILFYFWLVSLNSLQAQGLAISGNEDSRDPFAESIKAESTLKPDSIPFKVKNTITRRVVVEEAPEMPGLPAPMGIINVTVQLVEDPGLPDPPPPLPALSPDDPAVVERMVELQKDYQDTRLVFVSATVYDHSRTLFRCSASGGTTKEVSGWSNLDFNHFCGFAAYQMKGADGEIREHGLLMGIGNESTRPPAGSSAENDETAGIPEIPKLPDLASSGPSFVVTESDTSDRETMALIEGLHVLYRVDGARMKEAYHARVKAYEERKAYVLANPPVPKDVKIHFWKRQHPVGMAGGNDAQQKGNKP